MPFVPGSSLALLGVQLACIDAALKDVVTRIEIVRITAAKAAEQEDFGRTTTRSQHCDLCLP
jgi:hypothetical protein